MSGHTHDIYQPFLASAVPFDLLQLGAPILASSPTTSTTEIQVAMSFA